MGAGRSSESQYRHHSVAGRVSIHQQTSVQRRYLKRRRSALGIRLLNDSYTHRADDLRCYVAWEGSR